MKINYNNLGLRPPVKVRGVASGFSKGPYLAKELQELSGESVLEELLELREYKKRKDQAKDEGPLISLDTLGRLKR